MLSIETDALPPPADDKGLIPNKCLSKKHDQETHPEIGLLEEELYDAAILYCEQDYKEVTELITILKSSIVFDNGGTPKVDLFDVIAPTGEMFSRIENLMKMCSSIIIYITMSFLMDSSLNYQANELLINFVRKQGINSKTCQLMILTNVDQELPIGWQSLCRTKWYSHRDLALKKLKKMLQDAHKARLRRESYIVNSLDYRHLLPDDAMRPSKTPSPEVFCKPVNVYHAGVNYNYHINATNVQIGENAKMYGANHINPEAQEDPVTSTLQPVSSNPLPISTPPTPHVEVPSEASKQESLDVFYHMSQLNIHLPTGVTGSTQPDSSTASDGANTKNIKDIVHQKEVPIQKESAVPQDLAR